MNILKIAEVLESYSESHISCKLDLEFAEAVTEAVSLLISQGEQIADLQNELRDERYRHDRVQDFEVAEAEELRKAREAQRWIPVSERLPDKFNRVLALLKGSKFQVVARIIGGKWVVSWNNDRCPEITHWMPLPEPPKEEADA